MFHNIYPLCPFKDTDSANFTKKKHTATGSGSCNIPVVSKCKYKYNVAAQASSLQTMNVEKPITAI